MSGSWPGAPPVRRPTSPTRSGAAARARRHTWSTGPPRTAPTRPSASWSPSRSSCCSPPERPAGSARQQHAQVVLEALGRQQTARPADALAPLAVDEHDVGRVVEPALLRPDREAAPDALEVAARPEQEAHAPGHVLGVGEAL